jgi:hypothetical protein
MGKRGSELVEKKYSVTKGLESLIACFDRVITK